jgi:hypothetical protein
MHRKVAVFVPVPRRFLRGLLVVGLCGVLASCTFTATTDRRPATTRMVAWGLHVAGDLSGGWPEINALEKQVGRQATMVSGYTAWGSQWKHFDAAGAAQVAAHGATPIVAWEPWGDPFGTDLPQYSLASIIRGDHDDYIRRFAAEVRRYGGPVMIRFAHEMNGSWYPWSEQANGNQPGQYVTAWRHVHDIAAAAGADNAAWVWSPNVGYRGSTALASLYPGNAYVDWVALDGYNFGTSEGHDQPGGGLGWESFAQIFGASIRRIDAIAPTKPLMIAETGSPEAGGSKARWITDMFSYIRRTPRIRALVWFNENKETDWRIQSSDASVEAFRTGIRNAMYSGRLIA